MEKLIWLLNEFCREKRWDYVVVRYREKEHSFDTFVEWKVDYMTDLYVVSKRCWFIKWLVENDKIDRWKIEERISGDVSLYLDNREYYWRYKWLLMLLSISKAPIQVLTSSLI